MPSVVEPIAIPADCTLHASARTASFADAYTVLVPRSSLSATQIYAAVVQDTPGWVEGLMGLRNQLVKRLGLKNLGHLADVPNIPVGAEHTLRVGDRLGLFSLVRATPDELVMQDDDKHLTVQLSVLKVSVSAQHDRITLSTVVHVKNTLGKLYMLPVGPMHKIIAPAVLRRAPGAVARAAQVAT